MARKFLDDSGLTYLWSKLKTLFNGKVDKVSGKGLSTNDYTTTEKEKLAGIETGATKVIVDTELSGSSTNPLQNKAILGALNTLDGAKVDKVTGKGLSTNDFTTTLKNKLDGIEAGANKTTVDSALSSSSTNPVQNKVINTALGGKVNTSAITSDLSGDSTSNVLSQAAGHKLWLREMFRSYGVSPSNPYFTRYDGNSEQIETITTDISASYSNNNWGVLYEYFRQTVFKMGVYGAGGSMITHLSGNDGQASTVAGLFIKDSGNQDSWLSTKLTSYFTQSGVDATAIDSFKVEALGGKYSAAECTLKITMFTTTAKTYELQISATNAESPTYTCSGWYCLKDQKVDKVSGKGLSTNDYTTTEKNKLAGIETGANKTTVDSALSSSSTNPVQNKVINTALGNKVDKVSGKGLSTNDFTTTLKEKLENQADDPYATFITNAAYKYGDTTNPGTVSQGVSIIDLSDFAKKSDIGSVYKAKGTVTFANLPSLTNASVGDVYNVSNAFTTTSSFIEGAGKSYPAGTNVVCITSSNTKYWDVLAGSVDLSPYQKIADLVAITNAEIDTILAG